MPKSTASIADVLNLIFNATAYPWNAVTSLDIHLHTATPGVGGNSTTNEANYTSYALVSVNRNSGGWTVSGATSNAGLIQFPQCSGGTNVITFVSITPHASTELLYFGALNSSLSVSNGIQPQFSIGSLTITES
jgi:hypothetical protein